MTTAACPDAADPWVVWGFVVLVFVAWFVLERLRARARFGDLRRMLSERDAVAARDEVLQAFAEIDPVRVDTAYRWVQHVVEESTGIVGAAVRISDVLEQDLQIEPVVIDDLFEDSHEWRGDVPETPEVDPVEDPVFVRDLMATILHYGYEAYVDVPGVQRHRASTKTGGQSPGNERHA